MNGRRKGFLSPLCFYHGAKHDERERERNRANYSKGENSYLNSLVTILFPIQDRVSIYDQSLLEDQ